MIVRTPTEQLLCHHCDRLKPVSELADICNACLGRILNSNGEMMEKITLEAGAIRAQVTNYKQLNAAERMVFRFMIDEVDAAPVATAKPRSPGRPRGAKNKKPAEGVAAAAE
jgi:hypothetical protein